MKLIVQLVFFIQIPILILGLYVTMNYFNGHGDNELSMTLFSFLTLLVGDFFINKFHQNA